MYSLLFSTRETVETDTPVISAIFFRDIKTLLGFALVFDVVAFKRSCFVRKRLLKISLNVNNFVYMIYIIEKGESKHKEKRRNIYEKT